MTKEEKKEARKKLVQERREAKVAELRLSLSPEALADAESREMNTYFRLPLYVREIQEVKEAEERMVLIDKTISEMSPEEQNERDNRLAAQKRYLTAEDYASLCLGEG
jgi:hypothetical protein